MNSTLPVPATVLSIRSLSFDTSLLTLRTAPSNPVAALFQPGQFLELSLPGAGEIPISYCGLPSLDGFIELCVRHVGHVTTPLKNVIPGTAVGVRGPFGKGFPLAIYSGQEMVLIAGGLGMAPLRSLLLVLLRRRQEWGRLILLYGAREVGALLFCDELLDLQKRSEIELRLAVDRYDNGPAGPPNCRVVLLPALLEQLDVDPTRSYAAICGPPAVYSYLLTSLRRLGFVDERIHLSLERRMKCGVGRCGHCAVGTRLCCVDGPVFNCAELAGIEGALV